MSEFGGIEKPLAAVQELRADGAEPCGSTLFVGRDDESGVEFLVTVWEDGLVTIATRSDVGATWSAPHVLAERTGEATA